jgi:hypothetical protein
MIMTTNEIQKKRSVNSNLPTVNEFMDLLTRDQPLATAASAKSGYSAYTKYSRGS